jgi:hypothetical protein
LPGIRVELEAGVLDWFTVRELARGAVSIDNLQLLILE